MTALRYFMISAFGKQVTVVIFATLPVRKAMSFGKQYARDRKQRIEMDRRGRRSDNNVHGIGSPNRRQIAHRRSPKDMISAPTISDRPRSRGDGRRGARNRSERHDQRAMERRP
jgi:hypothetical protein